jgi:hypothetical protein
MMVSALELSSGSLARDMIFFGPNSFCQTFIVVLFCNAMTLRVASKLLLTRFEIKAQTCLLHVPDDNQRVLLMPMMAVRFVSC